MQDPISEARFRGWFETPAPRAPGRIVRYVAEQGTHLQWDDEAVDFTRRRMVPVRRNVTVGGDAFIGFSLILMFDKQDVVAAEFALLQSLA